MQIKLSVLFIAALFFTSNARSFIIGKEQPGSAEDSTSKTKNPVNTELGLIAYYPFNGNANDAGKNHYDGLVKRARLCEDKNGKPNSAYHFNGSDNYIQVDNIKDLDAIETITICAWVYPQSYSSYVAWLSKPACPYNSQIRAGFGDVKDKNWGLTLYNDSNWFEYNAKDNLIPLNQWSFVVISANTKTGEAKAYLNGKEVGVWQKIRKFAHSKLPMYIGYQVDDGEYFDGKIDEIRIYNRVLSAEEILTLYKLL